MNITREQLQRYDALRLRIKAFHQEITTRIAGDASSAKEELNGVDIFLLRDLIKEASRFLSDSAQELDITRRIARHKPNLFHATIILSQYLALFDAFRALRVELKYEKVYWRVEIENPESDDEEAENIPQEQIEVDYVPVEPLLRGETSG